MKYAIDPAALPQMDAPRTWLPWSHFGLKLRQVRPNRWRAKQQRVRERRAMRQGGGE